MNGSQPPVRRRAIRDEDLGGVVDLLVRSFPGRRGAYWTRGLARMGERPAVPGCPRYGFLLDDGARPVGVSLMLSGLDRDGHARCNLSSWAADPAHRAQAPMLVASMLRRSEITFTNLSAAPHTWGTIEAQGFRVLAEGRSLAMPVLARAGRGARVHADPRAWRDLPEAELLDDHARYGCRSLAVEAGGGLHPLVLSAARAGAGRWPLPLMRLLFCRDVAGLSALAGALGRWMAARGALGLLIDGGLPPGLPGWSRARRGRIYCRGPHPPRPGDLSYSEFALFGP